MTTPHLWTTAIADFQNHKRDIGLSDASIEAYGYRLRTVADQVDVTDPWSVSAVELRAWFASTSHLRPDTRRGYRTVVRAFYRWGVEEGHLIKSPAGALPRVPPPPPNPRPVPDVVYAQALRQARNDDDRLWVRLAAEGGLRRCEIPLIYLPADLIRDLTGWSLRVHGKGGKERIVPLTAPVARRLLERPPGWAFPGGQAGHVSAWWVGRRLSRILGDYTGHKLRHRAGTRWLKAADGNLRVVQELLGHADPRTTAIYTANDPEYLRDVVERAA